METPGAGRALEAGGGGAVDEDLPTAKRLKRTEEPLPAKTPTATHPAKECSVREIYIPAKFDV